MADRLDALSNDELRDLIRQSYEMVAAKASKTKRQRPARKSAVRSRVAAKKAAVKSVAKKKERRPKGKRNPPRRPI